MPINIDIIDFFEKYRYEKILDIPITIFWENIF